MKLFVVLLIFFTISGCSKNIPEKTKEEIRKERIKIISINLTKKYKAKDMLHELGFLNETTTKETFTIEYQNYLKATNENLIFPEYCLDDIFKDDNDNYWLSFIDLGNHKLILKTNEATAQTFIKKYKWRSWIVIARINKVNKATIRLGSEIDAPDTDDDNKVNLDDVNSNVEIDTSDLFIFKGDYIDAVEII